MPLSQFRRNRRAVCIMLAVLSTLAASACGGGNGGSEGTSDKALKIVFVLPATSNQFYLKAAEGAKEEADKLGGVDLIVDGAPNFPQDGETVVLNTLLAKQPDGLVVAPADPQAVVPALRAWESAGIPIVAWDSKPVDFDVVSTITSPNADIGMQAAKETARLLGESGEVAILQLTTAVPTLVQRQEGFLAEMEKYPGIKIDATEVVNGAVSVAQTKAESLLTRYPNLKAIYATYNDGTLAAAKAVKALSKDVLVAGSDGDKALFDLVRANEVQALVQQQPAEEGARAVNDIVKAIRKGEQKLPDTVIPVVLVTPKNIDQMTKFMY